MVSRVKEPTIPITELEQSAFCRTEDLETKPLEQEMKAGVQWQRIPTKYLKMSSTELDLKIAEAKKKLGEKLVILGHHYQRDEIIKYADFRGDSFKLSLLAASQERAEYIVFCGVHFMAETACILSQPGQKVILPNITAGCSMADMAGTDDVLDCWEDLNNVLAEDGGVIPVTYMNSTATIKALCGQNNGVVCTSSNAGAVFEWAYMRSKRIVFFPDQHLGRNTGLKKKVKLEEMALWNPFKPLGGNTEEGLRKSKLILWQGHCSVHTRFSLKQMQKARAEHPDVKVIVHPECTMDVVNAADYVGSTEYIIKTINNAPSGSKWAVGTEINLVNRIAKENLDKLVYCLDPIVCPCSTMYRIHPAYLLWVLDGLLEGNVVNEITVDEETSHYARIALDRMLSIS